jgi:2-polyprenyl-3-methyl-5-hydroxy-6-metoxy-1,4-benzoquinol methylase
MEGVIAAWYAKVSAKSLGEFRDEASRVAMRLRAGDRVLEIAPGPGFLAIELAKLGPYRVSGVDISHSFVRIARMPRALELLSASNRATPRLFH